MGHISHGFSGDCLPCANPVYLKLYGVCEVMVTLPYKPLSLADSYKRCQSCTGMRQTSSHFGRLYIIPYKHETKYFHQNDVQERLTFQSLEQQPSSSRTVCRWVLWQYLGSKARSLSRCSFSEALVGNLTVRLMIRGTLFHKLALNYSNNDANPLQKTTPIPNLGIADFEAWDNLSRRSVARWSSQRYLLIICSNRS